MRDDRCDVGAGQQAAARGLPVANLMIRLRDVAVTMAVAFGLSRLAPPRAAAAPPAGGPRRDTSEMRPRTQVLLLIGFTSGLALAIGLMVLMLRAFHSGPEPGPPARPPQMPRPPLLQAAPLDELAHLAGAQQGLLARWRWLSPAHSQATIPIGRAMQVLQGHTLAPVSAP